MAAIRPSLAVLEIEEGKGAVRRASAVGRQRDRFARLDLGLEGQEGALAADVAGQLVQPDRLASVAGAQLRIEGLDLSRIGVSCAPRFSKSSTHSTAG